MIVLVTFVYSYKLSDKDHIDGVAVVMIIILVVRQLILDSCDFDMDSAKEKEGATHK